ncbi:hypothetical protein T05_874 [Trichinella murrelli]|uniref:Uncharacterized protein n=1 Tax=Trichinella murrelli TaxID=144512 RepID=A0A0V0U7S5_9BILA|nr:hypothetical protein T05_874 [Trichinella murrelli]
MLLQQQQLRKWPMLIVISCCGLDLFNKNWPFYNLICSKASKMLFSQAHRSRCSRSHSTVHRPSRLPPVNDVAVQRTFSVNWCCSTFAVLKWMEIVLCILAIALIEAGVQMWRAYGFILFMSAFCLAITFAGLIIKFCQLQTGENSAFPLQKLEISFNIFAVFGFCIAFALLCYDCIKLFDEAEDYYQAKENRPDSIELNDWRNRIVATTLPQLIEIGMNFQIHPWFLYNSYPDIYCILQISTAGIADTLLKFCVSIPAANPALQWLSKACGLLSLFFFIGNSLEANTSLSIAILTGTNTRLQMSITTAQSGMDTGWEGLFCSALSKLRPSLTVKSCNKSYQLVLRSMNNESPDKVKCTSGSRRIICKNRLLKRAIKTDLSV